MLSKPTQDAIRTRIERTSVARSEVRRKVADRRAEEAEPDTGRRYAYELRKIQVSGTAALSGAEAVQGNTEDFQGVVFLTEGSEIRRAVGFVEVSGDKYSQGTGFMISPDLFITCSHVVENHADALATQVTFDRETAEDGRPQPATIFRLDPAKFELYSPENELDYAVVALGERLSGTAERADLPFCPLLNTPDRHVLGMNVNIIQHPNGLPKMVAVRNNLLTFRSDRTLLYETDTDHGSSGAPVFNDTWDVIALHHWNAPFLEQHDSAGRLLPTNANEGVRISQIYSDLASRVNLLPPAQQTLLQAALEYAKAQPQFAGPQLHRGPGREADTQPQRPPAQPAQVLRKPDTQETRPMPADPNEYTVTIPLEITVRIGCGGTPVAAAQTLVPPKLLTKASEAVHIDTNYSNRSGYSPAFIDGYQLPLPALSSNLAQQLAPLNHNEPFWNSGELKYEHFSVLLNKHRKMAIFTATNIDAAAYKGVDRDTGLVRESEGETWYPDRRVSADSYLDQTFYSAWSTYFDRGHLTRRTDPSWGTNAQAERANADTFHFTNCSPQHFRFNQTTEYWQGAERYVLENGVLQNDPHKRVTVFQGPIFDDANDYFAEQVQIPSQFFKVVVWKGAQGLKAVGLVVDQSTLMSEARHPLGPPHDVPSVDVSQWRVPITDIETRTGLNFGQTIRSADTIGSSAQPGVGSEASRRRPLRALRDILA